MEWELFVRRKLEYRGLICLLLCYLLYQLDLVVGTQQKLYYIIVILQLYYSGDYTFYTNLSQHDNGILTMQKNIWYLNNLKTADFCQKEVQLFETVTKTTVNRSDSLMQKNYSTKRHDSSIKINPKMLQCTMHKLVQLNILVTSAAAN